ncbi:hypothetical protein SCARD494_03425 [Seiridium cardinale]
MNNTTADSALRLLLVLSYATAISLAWYLFQATWLIVAENFACGQAREYNEWLEKLRGDPSDYTVRDGRTTERMVFHTFDGILMGGLTLEQMSEGVFDVTDPDVYAISCHDLIMKGEFDELAQADSMGNTMIMDAPSDIIETDPLESDRIKIDRMMRETPSVWLQALLGCIQSGRRFLKERDHFRSVFTQQFKPYLDSEVKVFEKTAKASLGRTLASVAVILGVCLAPGLESWTSVRTTDATNAQLGSYALLLAIRTGLLALVSSASHASTLAHSAAVQLKLQEHILDAPTKTHLEGGPLWDQHNPTEFGMYEKNKSTNENLHGAIVAMKMLWEAMSPKQRSLAGCPLWLCTTISPYGVDSPPNRNTSSLENVRLGQSRCKTSLDQGR